MISLALDCSTTVGSVALADEDGRLVAREEFAAGRGRGGALFVTLEGMMREIRRMEGRLDEIVVGLGPGSYSGVRQAIAAAVGLAAASGARLVGVPSVLGLRVEEDRYQTVADARRGTFYHAAVRGRACVAGPELLPDADALQARLAERPDWPVRIVEAPLPDGILADAPVVVVDAAELLATPRAVRLAPPLEPIYLRPVSVTLPKIVL